MVLASVLRALLPAKPLFHSSIDPIPLPAPMTSLPTRIMPALRVLLFLLLAGATAYAQQKPLPSIDYQLSITDQRTESFQIEAVLRNITSDTLIFHFPIWAP